MIEALLLASLADGVDGETLDVGTGDMASVRNVVERLTEMIDGDAAASFGAVDDRPLPRSVRADLGRRRPRCWTASSAPSRGTAHASPP